MSTYADGPRPPRSMDALVGADETPAPDRAAPGVASPSDLDPGAAASLGTLWLILAITAAWWALALWPLPGEAPDWLVRARAVCFNATPTGLPDASGWILLIGQPLGMMGVLVTGWGSSLARGAALLWRRTGGRIVVSATALAVLAGVGAAGVRVAGALGGLQVALPGEELPPPTYPRLDRAAPGNALVDQRGRSIRMADLIGRPVFVTFAFGHCETVCPAIVHELRSAREMLHGELKPIIVVLSLDPWRDTPSRLPHLATQFQLDPTDFVLSGSVDEVQEALDAWGIPRERDTRTGDITHPALAYLVDAEGTVAYGATGSARFVAELARRMSLDS